MRSVRVASFSVVCSIDGCGELLFGPADQYYLRDEGVGTAGRGGAAGAATSSSSSSSLSTGMSGMGGMGGVAGAAGGGGAPACVNFCIEVASDASLTPCPGTFAETAWNDLITCICMTGCFDDCKDNRCANKTSTAECDKCIQVGACAGALNVCTSN